MPTITRDGDRRAWLLHTPRAHTEAPYRTDLLWETLRPLKRPERARTAEVPAQGLALGPAQGPEAAVPLPVAQRAPVRQLHREEVPAVGRLLEAGVVVDDVRAAARLPHLAAGESCHYEVPTSI